MTCILVHASYSFLKWQAVKLTFFAPYDAPFWWSFETWFLVSIVQNNPYQLQYTGVGKKSITNCLWLSILRLCCQNLWNTHQNTKRRVEKVRRWTESRSARALTHHAERQGKQDWGNGKIPVQKEKRN